MLECYIESILMYGYEAELRKKNGGNRNMISTEDTMNPWTAKKSVFREADIMRSPITAVSNPLKAAL